MLHLLAARTMSACMHMCVCVSMSTSFLLFICSPSCTWWLIRNCKEIQSSHSKNCWELCAPPSNLKQSNIWPDELYYRILLICGLSEGNFLTEDSYSLRWSSACVLSHFSHVQLFATLWTVVLQVLCPWDSPGKNTGVGCHALLWGSSWPRSNLCLSNGQAGSLPLVPPGEPKVKQIWI